eukprot:2521453-Rhodomonas_salina.4
MLRVSCEAAMRYPVLTKRIVLPQLIYFLGKIVVDSHGTLRYHPTNSAITLTHVLCDVRY